MENMSDIFFGVSDDIRYNKEAHEKRNNDNDKIAR